MICHESGRFFCLALTLKNARDAIINQKIWTMSTKYTSK